MVDKEQNKNYNSKRPFSASNLYYNDQKDTYNFPMGQPMNTLGIPKELQQVVLSRS
ncbi:hypothetical protein GJU39_12935 [Pedobacter petrophilus]|uniref:Uncharacterized protein n=2 Tax=Pedobacter TaxID=84567 RepID=A0A7K0G061_9SPHI|nr:hypothetical protein [Pedobacter petrophilus]MRX76992.1 hypothetical protein [Pedobacter petrophilus]